MGNKYQNFLHDIGNYWHCEGRDRDTGKILLNDLRNPLHPISEAEFKHFLARAIQDKTISLGEYESLTSLDFESVDEISADLYDLQRFMYGDEQALV